MYARNSCCDCGCELKLDCGSDYLAVDGRALVFGDDGSWPESLEGARLLIESLDGCNCAGSCSIEVEGLLFAAGGNWQWPTASNMLRISDCCGWGSGYAYRNNGCADPAATVPLEDCNGNTVGYIYPSPVANLATTAVKTGCTSPSTLVGYSVNSIKSQYKIGGCATYPGEQRTAWFDLTAAQTRRMSQWAGRYRVLGLMPSGSTIVLAQGPVL